jgi:hypothetical protein
MTSAVQHRWIRFTSCNSRWLTLHTTQVDQVYFPHLEVVGDIANAVWQIKESIKETPKTWDLRYADQLWIGFL